MFYINLISFCKYKKYFKYFTERQKIYMSNTKTFVYFCKAILGKFLQIQKVFKLLRSTYEN